MARGLWVAAATAVLAVGLPAPAAAQNLPALCPETGTLEDLINLSRTDGGCIIGDKIYSEFQSTIVSDFGTTLTEAGIGYRLINRDNPRAYFHGFELIAPWFAPAGGILDHDIDYHVRTINGTRIIDDAFLSMFGEFILGPGGLVDISEDICIGGEPDPICPGPIASLGVQAAWGQPTIHQDLADWGPPYVSFVHVEKDILVVGGTQGAGFSNMHQTISQIPEPSTVILLSAGLGLMGVVARSRRRQA